MTIVDVIVLAGGAGTRMGLTGTRIPKVYLPVGLEPVINRPIKRALETNSVRKIYPLTRKKHPKLGKKVNLQDWAEDWYSKYFKEEYGNRVNAPLYEEELTPPPFKMSGAIVALWQAEKYLSGNNQQGNTPKPTHVLVLLGDNFIDQSIQPMLDASERYPDDVIIATRTLANRSQARQRFGVVQVIHKQETANEVFRYEEKPYDPQSAEISIGLYLFPIDKLRLVDNYLGEIKSSSDPENKKNDRAGAPGHFIGWLVDGNHHVRAVPFDVGHWIDVGTPSSFLASIIQVAQELVDRPNCARDLDVLGATENLSDKFYFLCQRACVVRNSSGNTVEMYFEGDDPIAALSGGDGQKVIPIPAIRKSNANKNDPFWNALASDQGQFGDISLPAPLEPPILMSGGVFLLDRGHAATWDLGWGVLPFFVRDFGAPLDAGRLTTAAGRMDKLDVLDVCVSEHAEEMIFLGTESRHSSEPKVLICAPPEWRVVARESTLDSVQRKRLLLPGIDPHRVAQERRGATGLVSEPETYLLRPPPNHDWTVRVFYRESRKDKWSLRHEYNHFVLIPDRPAATLEFRVIWLTSMVSGTATPAGIMANIESGSVGRLLGIVDGDGYRRTAVIVRAQELIEYVEAIQNLKSKDVLFRSDVEAGPGLDVVAATDETGRFSAFGRRLPVAPLTTSVRYLVDLLKDPLNPAGSV